MAFLFLLLYIIFLYIRPQEAGGFLYGTGVPWVLIIAIAITISWLPAVLSGHKKFVKAPQNTLAIGFLICVVLSQLTNLWLRGALWGFVDMGKNVVLFFFVANLIDSEKKFNTFVWLLITLSSYIAVQSIIQFITGLGVGGETLIQGRIRYIGIFNDPNDVALAFVIVIPLLFCAIRRGALLSKAMGLSCLGLLIAGIWLTNSRGGMLSFGAVVLFYVYRRFSKLKTVVIGSVIMAILYFAAPSRMSQLTIQEESARGRIVGMARGFWVMRASIKNYFFGGGYNAIASEYGLVAHNTIMQVAGETGLIGLFFFLALIYYSLKGLLMISEDTNNMTLSLRPWANALVASLVGFLVATLFLSRAYNDLIYILIGCSAALSNIAQQRNPALKTHFSSRDLRSIILVEIAVVVVAYIAVKTYF